MLLKCVVYENGRRITEIPASDIHSYVCRPGCFVWVAMRDRDIALLEEMREQFDLHPLAVEDAQQGHQRPKLEEYGGSLFAVLHMIEIDAAGELSVGEVDIFAGPNYVLSVRSGVSKGFDDVRARCEAEPEQLSHGSCYVLYALMDAVVDRYFPVLDRLEDELEEIEKRIFIVNGEPRANIQALYGLKQRLMTMKHAVAPMLEAVAGLTGGRVPAMVAELREYFRDIADHLQRLNQIIESNRDTVASATSVNLSMIAMQENETMKRLTAYAALVAIPTLIAGIYGMNFTEMP
ncbi:MAG TPA: magnesium and cobalt transport protein CorA, partial [Steroidobacteraceae bacterium]|nr:magnesium and cobalt transport protein CorA [Steroidobacteraceae bacterium]